MGRELVPHHWYQGEEIVTPIIGHQWEDIVTPSLVISEGNSGPKGRIKLMQWATSGPLVCSLEDPWCIYSGILVVWIK
ncbi:unnamed protein product [Staurois parvus]|uniref:Uncharacterized protein n=1 Tax=Staurois parvus TaxID=386267 RepID=A0ABN9CPX6_9NEOB|nr:unnamed protein product [Staurois parvus]